MRVQKRYDVALGNGETKETSSDETLSLLSADNARLRQVPRNVLFQWRHQVIYEHGNDVTNHNNLSCVLGTTDVRKSE